MGQVLAVVSGKGGTGKTSLCAGIASALALEGCRILCIDGDVGLRNLDLALGIPELAAVPFTDVMRDPDSLADIRPHAAFPTLKLLTAPVTESPESIDEAAFLRFMEYARDHFNYCLIDAPAGIGTMFHLAVSAADRVIVVSGSDPASLRDAASVSELLSEKPSGSVRLIVNRVIPKMITRMNITIDYVMDTVRLPLLGIVPEDYQVPLSAALGVPLLQYTDKKAAAACMNIAGRIQGKHIPLMKIRS